MGVIDRPGFQKLKFEMAGAICVQVQKNGLSMSNFVQVFLSCLDASPGAPRFTACVAQASFFGDAWHTLITSGRFCLILGFLLGRFSRGCCSAANRQHNPRAQGPHTPSSMGRPTPDTYDVLSYREVQALCKFRGLPAKGKWAALKESLVHNDQRDPACDVEPTNLRARYTRRRPQCRLNSSAPGVAEHENAPQCVNAAPSLDIGLREVTAPQIGPPPS